MSDTITMTKKELTDFTKGVVQITLAEMGVKGSPLQSGRIYRKQMVEILGYRGYHEAVNKGWLIVHKHDPNKTNSRVFAPRESWERFLKLHTNQRPNNNSSRNNTAAGGG